MGQNSAKVEMCGSPAAGRQTYKVDREFRTSRRALNVLSVRARLPEQAIKPRAHPGEHSGTSDLQVANNQFHLAFEVNGANGTGC